MSIKVILCEEVRCWSVKWPPRVEGPHSTLSVDLPQGPVGNKGPVACRHAGDQLWCDITVYWNAYPENFQRLWSYSFHMHAGMRIVIRSCFSGLCVPYICLLARWHVESLLEHFSRSWWSKQLPIYTYGVPFCKGSMCNIIIIVSSWLINCLETNW